MNFSLKRIATRCAPSNAILKSGYALLLALLLSDPATVKARAKLTHDSLAVATAFPSPHLDVAVFQVYKTAQFRVHFTHDHSSSVRLRLKDVNGVLLYDEVVTRSSYIRKFDLSALPDARYYFELQTSQERQVKEILLQTSATRTLVVL
jgi:hypothetical protein